MASDSVGFQLTLMRWSLCVWLSKFRHVPKSAVLLTCLLHYLSLWIWHMSVSARRTCWCRPRVVAVIPLKCEPAQLSMGRRVSGQPPYAETQHWQIIPTLGTRARKRSARSGCMSLSWPCPQHYQSWMLLPAGVILQYYCHRWVEVAAGAHCAMGSLTGIRLRVSTL